MDAEEIKLITDQNEKLERSLEKIVAIQGTVISAKMDLKLEESLSPIKTEIAKIISHNEKQNGWVKEHGERLDEIDGKDGSVAHLQAAEITNKANRKLLRGFGKRWKLWLFLFILFMFLVHSLLDEYNLTDIIDIFK